MSVKIELLDYEYGFITGSQINPDNSFNNPSDWEISPNGNEWVVSGGQATKITNTGAGRLKIPMTFVEGERYRIEVFIAGRTSGNFILANHLIGGSNGFNYNTNGGKTYDWIQGSSNLDKLSLYGSSSFDGSIEYASVYPLSNIDWEKSVVGELDVDDHTDFPMALTFQISDFTKITSTSGNYSKTFKIPATKNNNTILKNIFIPNVVQENQVTAKKKCRMTFDGVYSMEGLLQVDEVSGFGAIATHYNCVFFGSNLGWAEPLSKNMLHELEWGFYGEHLKYKSDNIKATWNDVDCNSSTSYLVYPVTSYGDYNPDGTVKTIQLLDSMYEYSGGSASKSGYYGWDSNGESYGTPSPTPDWRPGLWVKNTIEKIFESINYEIKSDFMETDMFKKLIWTLPNFVYNNPDTKEQDFSFVGSFRPNQVSLVAAPATGGNVPGNAAMGFFSTGNFNANEGLGEYNYTGDGRFEVNINDIISNSSSYGLDILLNDALMFNDSASSGTFGTFTVKEFGYYNISLQGIESQLAMGYKGGVAKYYTACQTGINVEVKTAGESHWEIISTGSNSLYPLNSAGNNQASNGTQVTTDFIIIAGIDIKQYLNIGDQLRITFGVKIFTSQGSQNFISDFFLRGTPSSRFNITLETDRVNYGQTYNLQDVIPTDVKQIDFIKGIAHAFNLQIQTDDISRKVFIEPFSSFYKPYKDAIDWTQKLDRTEESNDTWLKSELKRDVVFKYKSDGSDEKVKERGITFFNNIEDEFPFYETLPDTFDRGEVKFENPFFAGTFSSKDQDSVYVPEFVDNAFSGCLWTENANPSSTARPDKGYDFLPRLLYWNRYSPAGLGNVFTNVFQDMLKYVAVQTFKNTTIEYIVPNSDTPVSFAIISNALPQATMANREDILSPNLAYGNITVQNFDIYNQVYDAPVVVKGLYGTYYKKMIESLKRNPRIRTQYISLKISDIVNLDFSKLIYIDGCYWRINKISDFKPNKNESTKVELIEWFELGEFPIDAPQFGGGSMIINSDGSIGSNDNWGL
tara:strand:- start:4 stop:3084 length:3081 start_codon:yes stop_codon:yes gene_type:complete